MTIPSPRTFIEIILCILVTAIVMTTMVLAVIVLAVFALIEGIVDKVRLWRRRV